MTGRAWVSQKRAPAHSHEGELLLTLALHREAQVHVTQPVDVAGVAFSCFRVLGKRWLGACCASSRWPIA